MRALLVATLAALAGCNTVPVTVEVKVPVACVERKPVRPPGLIMTDRELAERPGDGDFVIALEIHRQASIGYIAELEAVVDGCAKLPAN